MIVEQGGMLPAISKASTPRRISPVLTGEEVIAKGIAAIAVSGNVLVESIIFAGKNADSCCAGQPDADTA
ncbi:MAG: hypothetical protein DME71_08735 [Verrucomicrobia bacterium]|nr:MAG: hypothetical protein DME71_08735 [Verrucomicrobiota bacterium]